MSSINDLKLALDQHQRKLARQERTVAATKAMITTLENLIAEGEQTARKTK